MATFEQNNLTAFQNRLNSNTLTAGDQAILNQALTSIIANWGNQGISVDPNTGVGTDPAPVDDEWFSILYNEALGVASGGSLTPASWTQPTWFIDPSGANGGNDANSGFTVGAPLKTWARLLALWGTNAPVLGQNTTITFLSSHVDNTDPVVFRPFVAKGALVSIQGAAPTVVTAGVVLAATTAKNRTAGANSPLISTIGATAVVGSLVQNTTAGKNSRAWAYVNQGAGSFKLTQPLALLSPGTITPPAEVDTWANGDTVNILKPIAVNIAEVSPTYIDMNAAPATNSVTLYQLTIFDPLAAGSDVCKLGDSVNIFECSTFRVVVTSATDIIPVINSLHWNLFNQGGATYGGLAVLIGGAFSGTISLPVVFQGAGAQSSLDGDFILGKATTITQAAGFVLGFVFLDTTLSIAGTECSVAVLNYSNAILYGGAGGQVNMFGTCRLANITTHTFTATFTAASLVTGILLNNVATGNSVTPGSPDVLNGNISTTVAHLDAAAGAAGFGGLAFNFGGASVASAS